ncbi:MAG: 23S rRNA (guanosine(2251)-2'-O)-methyltransferase RlmB [Candidatus Hepatoplasma vulgare]|nr:MAG: 23S rRNA (guanosine(2251)-2'-O)-methyltransferase RlmB [Candidatus Hepatoplasma sp.]
MFIYGKNSIVDLFKKDKTQIIEIYLDKKKYEKFYNILLENNIKTFPYEKIKIKEFEKKNTQKIIAKIKDIKYLTLNEIIEKNKDNNKSILIILDQIQDTRNFGSIVRSVSAFEGNGIIFSKNNSAPLNASSIKSSSGTWMDVDFCEVNSLNSTIEILKKKGFWIFAADSKAKDSIEHFKNFNKPIVLILGSEGFGIRKTLKEKTDFLIKIKISNKVESLNVSVAAALALYILKN